MIRHSNGKSGEPSSAIPKALAPSLSGQAEKKDKGLKKVKEDKMKWNKTKLDKIRKKGI